MSYIRYTIVVLLIGLVGCFTACTHPVYTKNSGLADPDGQSQHYFYVKNLWDVLGDNFNLPDETTENPAVREKINWYVSHPEYLNLLAKQAKPYLYYIYQQVKRRGLPAELALLPMVESNYDPFTYSRVGAAGLWQMMPGTASGFGLKIDWWYDGRRDITASTNAALDYFSYLSNFFNGNWLLAIAAYDAGEGTVENAVRYNAKHGKSTNFWHLPLPGETKRYIPKLLALATIIKHPYEYPIDLPFIPDTPYLTKVDVGTQIDLARAAKMAGISLEDLAHLNPGFNRWATDPDGPHTLVLPIDKAANFKEALDRLPKHKRVTWMRYKVKPRDTLISIAEQYKTEPRLIRKVNRLHGNQIRVGHILLIPLSTSKLTRIVLKSEQHYLSSPHKFPEIHYINYTVKPGDTLSEIARRYSVGSSQIRFWNGLKYRAALTPGRKLIIWPPHRKHGIKHMRLIHYKVRPGDSLSTLAEQFYTSTKTLRRINHLRNNVIRVGETLKLPAETLHYVKHYNMIARYRFKKIVYRVRSGDTLSTIANRYHVTIEELTHWNRIPKANQLKLHQMLVIYKTETNRRQHQTHHHIVKKHKTKKHKTYHHSTHYNVYHVKSGDTLSTIAQRHHVSTMQLKQWNHIKHANQLKLKQRLVIYRHSKKNYHHVNMMNNFFRKHATKKIIHHVKHGETLSSIAHHFHVTSKDIKRWNRIKNPKQLQINQPLVIYP